MVSKNCIGNGPLSVHDAQKHTKNRYATHIQHIPIVYKYIEGMLSPQSQIELSNSRKEGFVSIKARKIYFKD